MKKSLDVRNMVLAAMFLSLAYILPFITGQIPEVGAMLCPMHIPVLLCGFICGGVWGALIGFVVPLLRSVTLGMPILFPNAFCMAFELMTYGAAAGALFHILPKKRSSVYHSLLAAMLAGRVVWGILMLFCLGIRGESFGFSAFMAGAVTNAVPGIIIQIVVIPILVIELEKMKNL